MVSTFHAHNPDWPAQAVEALGTTGCAVITGVLDPAFLDECRAAMYRAQSAILRDVGRERLQRAGELGVLRLMMKYEPFFYRFLEVPALLTAVDLTVSPTAILHLQNGFILPSFQSEGQPRVFQNSYHQDFPRVMGGYLASMNVLFAIDRFDEGNGATWVAPGTHQRQRPSDDHLAASAMPVVCPAGSMILFDSTLWHAAGANTSGHDRLAVNHQFTRSFIKQQVDYVRAVGEDAILSLPPRSQQLLGWYTRVVTSLDEYYQPAESRLYRAGQG
jgi:ectoine hydroxylase-related dioxygenase (phytanoyl-CoA dioxygenase family)